MRLKAGRKEAIRQEKVRCLQSDKRDLTKQPKAKSMGTIPQSQVFVCHLENNTYVVIRSISHWFALTGDKGPVCDL